MAKFQIGDKVFINSYHGTGKPRIGPGEVIHIFKAGEEPDHDLVKAYYGVSSIHKNFKGFMQTLEVDRVVVRREDDEGGFLVCAGNAVKAILKKVRVFK